MEIDIPLRIVIVAPSILFFVTVIWSLIFREHLTNMILNVANARKRRKVVNIIDLHFMESLLAEATIVFLVNGLTILLVLSDEVSGGIQMIVGIVFSMTLLLYLITSGHQVTQGGFLTAYLLLLAFVSGQLLFLGFYGLGPFVGWVDFILMIGVTVPIAFWIKRRAQRQH